MKLIPITLKQAHQSWPDLEERNNHDYAIDLEAARFSTDGMGRLFIDVERAREDDRPASDPGYRRIYTFINGKDDAWSFEDER